MKLIRRVKFCIMIFILIALIIWCYIGIYNLQNISFIQLPFLLPNGDLPPTRNWFQFTPQTSVDHLPTKTMATESSLNPDNSTSKPRSKFSPVNFAQNYTINPIDACKNVNNDILLLIAVPTEAKNTALRSFIRSTWGNKTDGLSSKIVILFFFGQIGNSSLQANLIKESEEHEDIVQGNYSDNFRNLTYKSMSLLQWSNDYCPQAEFLLKVDDDVIVHSYRLVRLLTRILNEERSSSNLICWILSNRRPMRDKNVKWHVGVEEYSGDSYPSYCCGRAYIIPVRLLPVLVNQSSSVSFLSMEDVFVTGLVREVAKFGLKDIGKFYTDSDDDLLKKSEVIFSHSGRSKDLNKEYELWDKLKGRELRLNNFSYLQILL